MDRREILLGIAALTLALPALGRTGVRCPLCAGALINAGSVEDDTTRASLNLSLWSRSTHGDFWPLHTEASPFCTQCYQAYRDSSELWERSSEQPASFHVPLQGEVLGFPLSPWRLKGLRTVYSQTFFGEDASHGRIESIGYWVRDSRELRVELQDYADSNSMNIDFKNPQRRSTELFVSAETPKSPFKPMPLHGAT